MERIEVKNAIFVDMKEDIHIVRELSCYDHSTFIGNVDMLDALIEDWIEYGGSAEFLEELVELRDRFNIDLPEDISIVFWADYDY